MVPIEYFWRHADQLSPLVLKDEKECYSGIELYSAVEAISRALISKGIKPQDRVAVLCGRSAFQLISILAVWNVGATYVPLSLLNPQARMDYVLRDCGVTCILVKDEELSSKFHFRDSDPVIFVSNEIRSNRPSFTGVPRIRTAPDDVSYVIYTSGTTGQPKGVVITNSALGQLTSTAAGSFSELSTPTTFLQIFDFSSDASIWDTLLWLVKGGTFVVSDAGQNIFKLVKTLLEHRPSYICCPASLFSLLMSVKSMWEEYDFSFVKTLITAASYCPPKIALQIIEAFPAAHVYNCYGPTETTVYCSWAQLKPDSISETRPVSIGKVLPGLSAYLYDGIQLHPASSVDENVEMELCIAGAQLFREYWHAPELTKQKVLYLENGERVYKTGDLVTRKGDEFFYFGRTDDTIKVKGHRINLGEIELVLAAVPFISNCAVVDVPGENYEAYLAAFYTCKPNDSEKDESAQVVEIAGQLTAQLPAHMIPKAIHRLPEFQFNATGKIDRNILREKARAS